MSSDLFPPEVLIRLVGALGIAGVAVGLYWFGNRMILTRVRSKVSTLELARQGTPVLLYFTTPTCAPCKIVQRPAIQQLSQEFGARLQVLEIDASQQAGQKIASQWGVMSVPTTFIIDAKGRPRHVNHGVAPAEKLIKQISEIF